MAEARAEMNRRNAWDKLEKQHTKPGLAALYHCPFCPPDAGLISLNWLPILNGPNPGGRDGVIYLNENTAQSVIVFGCDGKAAQPCPHMVEFSVMIGLTRGQALKDAAAILDFSADWFHPWSQKQGHDGLLGDICDMAIHGLYPDEPLPTVLVGVQRDEGWDVPGSNWGLATSGRYVAARDPLVLFEYLYQERLAFQASRVKAKP